MLLHRCRRGQHASMVKENETENQWSQRLRHEEFNTKLRHAAKTYGDNKAQTRQWLQSHAKTDQPRKATFPTVAALASLKSLTSSSACKRKTKRGNNQQQQYNLWLPESSKASVRHSDARLSNANLVQFAASAEQRAAVLGVQLFTDRRRKIHMSRVKQIVKLAP